MRTCLEVSSDPMFLWISSNSCPLNLLLVRSHQAEIIIVKRLLQGRKNVTSVGVERRSCDQGCQKKTKTAPSPSRSRCPLPTRQNLNCASTKLSPAQGSFYNRIAMVSNRQAIHVFRLNCISELLAKPP